MKNPLLEPYLRRDTATVETLMGHSIRRYWRMDGSYVKWGDWQRLLRYKSLTPSPRANDGGKLSKPTEVIDPSKVLRLFGGREAYKRFILDGLGEGHKEEYYKVEDQRFLGAKGFGDKIREKLGKEQRPMSRRSIAAVFKKLAQGLGIGVESLRSPDRSWSVSRARTMIAYVLIWRLGYGIGEVAAYLGRDIATVGTLVARLFERMRSEEQLRRKVERFSKIVES